jgi:hypothetical protein
MGMAAVIYKKGAPPTNVMNSRLFMRPPGGNRTDMKGRR